jgi:enamine deaminase RidA (YjgF/YER057c/UK114 family)
MPKREILSDRLATPNGQYCHATVAEGSGRLVFVSGMTARRADGSIAGIGDVRAQTRQVCENLKTAVEAAGGSLKDVCRVDVYVRSIGDLAAVQEVRREFFSDSLPASTLLEVSGLVSPEYLVEMSAIAVVEG